MKRESAGSQHQVCSHNSPAAADSSPRVRQQTLKPSAPRVCILKGFLVLKLKLAGTPVATLCRQEERFDSLRQDMHVT